MDHYIDLRLLPDPEFPTHELLSALYAKLHRELVKQKSKSIGVSFPGYREKPPTLGDTLRLIAIRYELEKFMEQPWIGSMSSHLAIGSITPVPEGAKHRSLRRVQAKSSPERLRRRQQRRHGLSESDLRQRIPDNLVERLRLPHVRLRSRSTGQVFPLFFRLSLESEEIRGGEFNTYGISHSATIPWF